VAIISFSDRLIDKVTRSSQKDEISRDKGRPRKSETGGEGLKSTGESGVEKIESYGGATTTR
jgi:hypothetical protein